MQVTEEAPATVNKENTKAKMDASSASKPRSTQKSTKILSKCERMFLADKAKAERCAPLPQSRDTARTAFGARHPPLARAPHLCCCPRLSLRVASHPDGHSALLGGRPRTLPWFRYPHVLARSSRGRPCRRLAKQAEKAKDVKQKELSKAEKMALKDQKEQEAAAAKAKREADRAAKKAEKVRRHAAQLVGERCQWRWTRLATLRLLRSVCRRPRLCCPRSR